MQRKQPTQYTQMSQLKPQLYALQAKQCTFSSILMFFKKSFGFYPGTLLTEPVAFGYLTIKENILLAYSIAHPKHRNKETFIMDELENSGVDIEYISTHHFSSLPLHTSLDMQLFIHYLCETKIILVEDWINDLPDDELKTFILLLKNLCYKQDVTVLINSTHEKVRERCDEILSLDDHFP